ncbi:hypothetical protein CHUUTOTORO_02240 [Serratia phage vB_SmaM-ChuuTotoro]|nr:hypothetical protein CHUUTOTORO_02240 [Serratia phage vB_SmaM-ChuuTotoro]
MRDLLYYRSVYKKDELNLEKILQLLDDAYKDRGEDHIIDRPLAYLRDILTLGEAYRKELYGVRVTGLPKFVAGDMVKDKLSEIVFEVTNAQVELHEDQYKWMYRKGIYWIPEEDLEEVQ